MQMQRSARQGLNRGRSGAMNAHSASIFALDNWPLGAHLVSPRRGYTHHGIYVGGGRVIHYSGFSQRWWRGPVEEVSIEQFALGHPVAMRDTAQARHRGAERVERARLRLGENRFSLWSNNCEHFCNWCVQGISCSTQIDHLRTRIHAIASTLGRLALCVPSR
jgi:hypothetical protein